MYATFDSVPYFQKGNFVHTDVIDTTRRFVHRRRLSLELTSSIGSTIGLFVGFVYAAVEYGHTAWPAVPFFMMLAALVWAFFAGLSDNGILFKKIKKPRSIDWGQFCSDYWSYRDRTPRVDMQVFDEVDAVRRSYRALRTRPHAVEGDHTRFAAALVPGGTSGIATILLLQQESSRSTPVVVDAKQIEVGPGLEHDVPGAFNAFAEEAERRELHEAHVEQPKQIERELNMQRAAEVQKYLGKIYS